MYGLMHGSLSGLGCLIGLAIVMARQLKDRATDLS